MLFVLNTVWTEWANSSFKRLSQDMFRGAAQFISITHETKQKWNMYTRNAAATKTLTSGFGELEH